MNLNGRQRFVTTRWSLVLAAVESAAPGGDEALATLCESYWRPVYAFVRRNGYQSDEAADLTQAFFARMLEKNLLKAARPERGRFRSFLLASLRNFLVNQHDWRHALKRGGHTPHLSLEFQSEERHYQLEPADECTPEHLYERRWAASVIGNALRRLDASHLDSPRRLLFERLRPFLTDDRIAPRNELASELGISSGALRVALHRLRRQYAAILRTTIAETVERDDEVDDELRYLQKILSR